jgi:prophage regulatory protein
MGRRIAGVGKKARRDPGFPNFAMNATAPAVKPLFDRLPNVIRLTGLGRSTIYRLTAERRVPGPVRLGSRAVAARQAGLERRPATGRPPPRAIAPGSCRHGPPDRCRKDLILR